MAELDDELIKAAEEDAQEVAFIQNQLPIDVKEKFTEDDIYYFVDVILEYFSDAKTDDEGYIDVDLDEVAAHVVKQAKKDKIGDFDTEDVFFVVQAELDYNETLE
ncbi:MAG: hypothetical protein IJ557_12635 [Bacteroidaceae bacterium]|jgi:hypothetical protein|nr:hypothetical protein [Bacteroidaceae bacterium]MBQ8675960.1 hypothetical protein [Bacteroidaceae bacterium]MBR1379207.1 hypothetical protein [Bacteroidaceae bacterium]MBR1379954.1 hypothetical protein [Bacteroidaceae bacterium]